MILSPRFSFLFFISTLLTLSACSNYKAIQFKKVENVHFAFDDKNSESGFALRIQNPNNAGLKLRSAKANFVFLDKSLGEATLVKAMYIPANSESMIPFKLSLVKENLPNLIPAGLDILFGNASKQLNVNGYIRIRKFLWYKKINFEINQKIDLNFIKSLKF